MNRRLINETKKVLDENKQSLDDIQQHIWDTIILNQLNNSEVAALFTALMREALSQPQNIERLAELGITPDMLNTEAVTTIQRMLTDDWLIANGYAEDESNDTTDTGSAT